MVLLLIFLVVVAAYLYLKWIYSYWKRADIEHPKPAFLYGNVRDVMLGKIGIGDHYKNFYNSLRSKGLKHGGMYEMFTPAYMPVDLEIIKCILQKDFNSFMNHGEYVNEELDPLTGHLLALENEKWKKLRAKLTPTFTSGKMKMMFPTMVACTEGLQDILAESAKIQDVVDIKEVLLRFTTDIIGSAAFGIDCNSLKNPNSIFREFGRKIFNPSSRRRIKRIISNTLPKTFLTLIRFKRTDVEIEDFFMGVVKSTVDYREKNNIFRKDFMHLLIQLKNRGTVTDDGRILQEEGEHNRDGHFLTLNEIAAQCFVFYIAGFETSSTTMTFALLELARNPDIQDKLRQEIHTVLKKHDNQITYDAIMEMKYLDKVVNEALRLHPPASITGRICNATYKVPGTDLIIKAGTKVRISILGIHRDPEYYPEPERFDPERFSDENIAQRPKFSFMPFGEGPRVCIGARFGLLQSKVGLTSIIRHFSVTLNKRTKIPVKYAPKAIISSVDGDVWLNVRKVEC